MRDFVILALLITFSYSQETKAELQVPLIGILAQPQISQYSFFYQPHNQWTMVIKSYVDWIEQAGAIPVLIPFDLSQKMLDIMIDSVQGILLPGGPTDTFNDQTHKSSDYQLVSNYIINRAIEKNDKGIYYPIMGICLGFQSMVCSLMKQDGTVLKNDYYDISLPHVVTKTKDYDKSKFWKDFDQKLVQRVFDKGYIFFDHQHGFEPEALLARPTFNDSMIITSTSKTNSGAEFVSSIEHIKYPFFGSQFNPEKTLYERITDIDIPRDADVIRFSSDIALFFVEKVRPYSKKIGETDSRIRAFMSIYLEPIRTNWNMHEKLYAFPRYRKKSMHFPR